MGIRTVQKIFDDLDGSELPDDTKPYRAELGGQRYDFYLSKESEKKVEDLLSKLVDGAVVIKQGGPGVGNTARDLATIRRWLVENGETVRPSGLIAHGQLAKYEQAHKA